MNFKTLFCILTAGGFIAAAVSWSHEEMGQGGYTGPIKQGNSTNEVRGETRVVHEYMPEDGLNIGNQFSLPQGSQHCNQKSQAISHIREILREFVS